MYYVSKKSYEDQRIVDQEIYLSRSEVIIIGPDLKPIEENKSPRNKQRKTFKTKREKQYE